MPQPYAAVGLIPSVRGVRRRVEGSDCGVIYLTLKRFGRRGRAPYRRQGRGR